MTRIATGIPYISGYEYDVAELRPFLTNPADHPDKVGNADVFKVAPPTRASNTLTYEYMAGRGFSLVWRFVDENGRQVNNFVSRRGPHLMGQFLYLPDQAVVPEGSFVSGEKFFQVLEDFAKNPNILSGAIEWVAWSDINWPEP